jgi:hypothetical protein
MFPLLQLIKQHKTQSRLQCCSIDMGCIKSTPMNKELGAGLILGMMFIQESGSIINLEQLHLFINSL